MKSLENLKIISISILLVAGLSACNKPGPAETAGKEIDQTVDAAGKKLDETFGKVGEKLDAQGEKVSIAIDDAGITSKVKAAFFAEAGLKTLQISVDTVNGVVTLSGSVDSPSNSDRANTLAGAVAGVTAVDNRLVQKSSK
jgi:predicted amino acid-binding ACT domain protein